MASFGRFTRVILGRAADGGAGAVYGRHVDTPAKQRVLIVYYSHTQQALRVAEAMAEVFGERGFAVTQAGIEFTDVPPVTEPTLKVVFGFCGTFSCENFAIALPMAKAGLTRPKAP